MQVSCRFSTIRGGGARATDRTDERFRADRDRNGDRTVNGTDLPFFRITSGTAFRDPGVPSILDSRPMWDVS
jgi:hypothetical protein